MFVDASFLIALLDDGDQRHAKARRAAPRLMRRTPWRIHALAIAEVVAVIGSRHGGRAARTAYTMARDTMEFLVPAAQDLDDAMEAVVRFDGRLSLSDALSLHLMAVVGDDIVASFDADFDGKDVERVP